MKSIVSSLKNPTKWQIIWIIAISKLLIHFYTLNNFELHRDAYLYYAQSEHPAWGYFAVPPSIAFFGKLSTTMFGNTVFGLRFFPALVGALNIFIIGAFTKQLGGSKKTIFLACLAYLLSPAYLHSNALFQPVSFNQFYWLLSGYLIFKMITNNSPKMWIWIGITFGLAFLNKYSIIFFCTAFILSLLLTGHRKLLLSKYFVIALGIGLFIISPNVLWQYENNWPVIQHMNELRATQLVHVNYSNFIFDQLLMNMQAIFIWIFALVILLFHKNEKKYKVFGYLYLIIIILLLAGSGKSYYTLGIYPILFAFGAFFLEKYTKTWFSYVFGLLCIFMPISLYLSLSFDGVPLSTFEKVQQKGAFRWEDGLYYDIPQDMADMTGWKEIGEEVKNLYLSLGDHNQYNCDIYCYNYGQAGAIMFYGKSIGIPQPIVPNGSFILWAPDNLSKEYLIYVHSELGNVEHPDIRLPQLFEKVTLVKTIENKYFRENGTKIYLCESPNEEAKSFYRNMIQELKEPFIK